MIATILLITALIYLFIGIFLTVVADALGDDTGDAFTVILWPLYILKLLGGL
jgi:hypothetical protein